jgi:hypothetical protein
MATSSRCRSSRPSSSTTPSSAAAPTTRASTTPPTSARRCAGPTTAWRLTPACLVRSPRARQVEPGSSRKISATCANCPMAVKGSKVIPGTNKAVTACSQHRMLALVPDPALGLKDIPPLRLKIAMTSDWDKQSPDQEQQGWFAFSNYVDWLVARNVKHTAALVTKMKFDPEAAYPKIFFSAERYLERTSWRSSGRCRRATRSRSCSAARGRLPASTASPRTSRRSPVPSLPPISWRCLRRRPSTSWLPVRRSPRSSTSSPDGPRAAHRCRQAGRGHPAPAPPAAVAPAPAAVAPQPEIAPQEEAIEPAVAAGRLPLRQHPRLRLR